MSTVTHDPALKPGGDSKVETEYQTEDGRPNEALLQDRTPPALQASSNVAILTAVLGVLFMLLSYFPLWHTDLWGHLAYGRWMFSRGGVPITEPLMPLAEGVRFVDTAWLSQLSGYLMFEQFGVAGIQFLYASCIVLAAALLTFSVYRRTGNVLAALLALGAFYWGEFQQLMIVRPQLAGMVCFMAVLMLATSSTWRKWYVWTIPVLFAVWANVHGSFVVGLMLLGALLIGRGADVFRRSRNLGMVFAERKTRGLLYALELSALAVLLNPYGLAVYPEVFAVARNPNLQSLIEWDPLTLRMKQGQAAAAIALGLIVLYRMTPRRIATGEVLLLCGLGASAMWTSRMIVWWVPVAAYFLGIHLAAVWRVWRAKVPGEPRKGGLWTVVTLGLMWVFFAYTPFGATVVHGPPEDPDVVAERYRKSLSTQTPIDAVDYLRRNPPQGQVFNTYEWGDYLLWAGPEEIQVFVASHAHLVPEEVWRDYLQIAAASGNWQRRLDEYGVNTVVVDRRHRRNLIRRLDEMTETWERKYSNNISAVFVRKNPI